MVSYPEILNNALPAYLRMPYVWVLPPHALGDSYLSLCLAKPFAEQHPDTPLTIIVPAEHARVFELFPELLERACSFANLTIETCRQMSTGNAITPGVPFVAHPEYLADSLLIRMVGRNGFRHWDAWRHMFGLDHATPFNWHVATSLQREAAALRFRSLGLPAGRTAVLFPKSNAVDSSGVDWRSIVGQLRAHGWAVCCNMRPDEPLLDGVVPVDLPLGELCPFLEMAGWAVAARSGICDIMVPARCRKTVIYPHELYLSMFSFAGIASDCDEKVGNSVELFA